MYLGAPWMIVGVSRPNQPAFSRVSAANTTPGVAPVSGTAQESWFRLADRARRDEPDGRGVRPTLIGEPLGRGLGPALPAPVVVRRCSSFWLVGRFRPTENRRAIP
jgi:hypothetical protein